MMVRQGGTNGIRGWSRAAMLWMGVMAGSALTASVLWPTAGHAGVAGGGGGGGAGGTSTAQDGLSNVLCAQARRNKLSQLPGGAELADALSLIAPQDGVAGSGVAGPHCNCQAQFNLQQAVDSHNAAQRALKVVSFGLLGNGTVNLAPGMSPVIVLSAGDL